MIEDKIKIGYNAAFVLTDLIGSLVLPLFTLNEFSLVMKVLVKNND